MTPIPDRLVMSVPGMDRETAALVADEAALVARHSSPKLTGVSSFNITPIFGAGWFGIHWLDAYLWYQEMGVKPFTMRSLAGKTIPMWIDDPSGAERKKNPKAKTRTTVTGRIQILIFRRAAKMGQTKTVRRGASWVEVPTSYPGAPGRIGSRHAAGAVASSGAKIGGQIQRPSVGVRWRYPGMQPKYFLHRSMEITASMWAPEIGRKHGPIVAMSGGMTMVRT